VQHSLSKLSDGVLNERVASKKCAKRAIPKRKQILELVRFSQNHQGPELSTTSICEPGNICGLLQQLTMIEYMNFSIGDKVHTIVFNYDQLMHVHPHT